jgi:hypothetical protein
VKELDRLLSAELKELDMQLTLRGGAYKEYGMKAQRLEFRAVAQISLIGGLMRTKGNKEWVRTCDTHSLIR